MTMNQLFLRFLRQITANVDVRGVGRLVEFYYRFRPKDFYVSLTGKIGFFSTDLELNDRLQRHIYFGIFERDETKCLKSILREGGVVFDIGANIGYFTLLARSIVGASGEVHAFEPVPSNFYKLAKAIEANRLTNVFLNQMAVSHASGKTIIYTSGVPGECGWASMLQPSLGESFEAQMIGIDEYVATYKLDTIDFIKIDVEGAEMRVLKGMEKLLATNRVSTILIEINEKMLRTAGTYGEAIHLKLLSYGYKAFDVRDCRQRFPIYSLSEQRRDLRNLLYRI